MANIARFLGFSLRLVCFVHGNNVFLSLFACSDVWNGVSCCFLFRLELETMFWLLFICWGDGDVVSDCFWFVGRGETVFLGSRWMSWEERHGFYSIFVVHEISIVP